MRFTKFALLNLILLTSLQVTAQKIKTSYKTDDKKENFSGKVFLYLSKDIRIPKDGMVGFESVCVYRIEVKNIKPGQTVLFEENAISYPVTLNSIERGEYNAQVVWDRDLGGRAISTSPGNFYNAPLKVNMGNDKNAQIEIVCNEVVKEKTFVETEFVKEVKPVSSLLTAFYKRPTTINAAVILPKEYFEQPGRKFPVLYNITGYGGDYYRLSGTTKPNPPIDTTAAIRVYADGNCRLGHSVYANSDNNGPWGDAFTKELIPEVEKRFRTNGARLLSGHSSGGWTVLWLQTQYPKLFTACWSSSPDPVDFRNFQQVDLYKDKNIFFAADSSLRQVATVAGRFPWASMKNVFRAEMVIDRGEQMHSFDAVFGAHDSKTGMPRYLVDPITGQIDSTVMDHWKKYDISLFLRNNWASLKNDLDGKIRISVGNHDNFYLNYAVKLLDEEMKKINANIVFAYFPGDHFTVSNPEYSGSGNKFLQERYREWQKQATTPPAKGF